MQQSRLKFFEFIYSGAFLLAACFIITSTVSTRIDRHSWLELQGTVLRHTVVIFSEKLSKNYSIYSLKVLKMTTVQRQKFLYSNRMPAIYLRRYAMFNCQQRLLRFTALPNFNGSLLLYLGWNFLFFCSFTILFFSSLYARF